MTFWEALVSEAVDAKSPYLAVLFLVTLTLVRLLHGSSLRLRGVTFFFGLHLVLLPLAGAFRAAGSPFYRAFRLPELIFGGVAGVLMVGALVFPVLMPRLRLKTPRILQDVLVAVASLIALFVIASKEGFNLSGLIATSAVLTAIIGFSFQDSLASIMGGLALQLDNSIEVGDWIKVGDVSGQVAEIRWRHTAVETRNWETVLLPNSLLMKGQVTVLGRRTAQPRQWRRWVMFNVDFRYQPSDVIEAITNALKAARIERVATEPPPNCILLDFQESYCRYAVRYWLTDLSADDATDSTVRMYIYVALRRAGMPLSIPAHAIFMTEESSEREARKSQQDLSRRKAVLAQVNLFARLSDEDKESLARSLLYAPFAKGEVITRQGSEAHWLYLVLDGTVAVTIAGENGQSKEVARLGHGSFFGEMSLMTGEPRGATVTALTDVECYRLDKAAFQEIIQRRPELASDLAAILAERRLTLINAREGLSQSSRAGFAEHERDILGKIRSFFGLSS